MSDEKKSRRRRFSVDGETEEAAATKRVRARPIDRVFGLDREDRELPEDAEVAVVAHTDQRMAAFVAGRITLGDLEGISKQEQYEMAKLGHSYLEGGKLEKASTIFEGLIALDPFDAYFRMAIASIAQQEGRLSDAEEGYSSVLQINPYSPTAFANRGEVRVQLGRLKEGAEDLIAAITHDPKGAEDATIRARATLKVLQEKLTALAKNPEAFAQGGPLSEQPPFSDDGPLSPDTPLSADTPRAAPKPRAAKPRAARPRGAPRGAPPRRPAAGRPSGRAAPRARPRRPGPRKK